jgi:hypothetical protein
LLLLVAVAAALAAGAGLEARATPPQTLRIEMWGTLTGPTSVDGRWAASGVLDATGTYHEDFRFAGNSIHGVKVLASPQGTIVLDVQALYAVAPDGLVSFSEGSWSVVSATGAYAGLRAGGQPAVTGDSFGDIATGTVHVVHAGDGHFD